jgi:hypothetical protein
MMASSIPMFLFGSLFLAPCIGPWKTYLTINRAIKNSQQYTATLASEFDYGNTSVNQYEFYYNGQTKVYQLNKQACRANTIQVFVDEKTGQAYSAQDASSAKGKAIVLSIFLGFFGLMMIISGFNALFGLGL